MRAFWLWLKNEWRLMKLEDWSQEPRSQSVAGSVADPRVALMTLRQRALGKHMRRQKRSLLSGKAYIPVLTKDQPAPVAESGKVVRLRRRAV